MIRTFIHLRRACRALFLITFLAATPAFAHPHVYANMRTAVIVNAQNQVAALRLSWTFDENYTRFALEDMDLNKDGEFSAEEIRPLTDENIANLVESNYFAAIRQADKTLPQGKVVEYDQTLANDKLTLNFVLPLAQPVDPKFGEVQIKIYDPDFFIAFDYVQGETVKVEGSLAPGCAISLKPLPTDDEIDKTRAFLFEQGTDWKPENGEDFGSMFAQALAVNCT